MKNAAIGVDNERDAHTEFKMDSQKCGVYGSGYQKRNKFLMSLQGSSAKDENCPQETGNIIHGYLGTFQSVLYQSVVDQESSIISIAPTTFSVGMFSWFPLYFPLREPQLAVPGSILKCNIWRKCDEGRVWYEWCSEVISEKGKILSVSNVHNPNGRSCHVRL